ncbi:MAG: DUF4238 domain-containing protein [Acidimicrobiaceae bacterium]|nr:DUF4238 domain-containing protein [Acidimicrobiaceae bacterium]
MTESAFEIDATNKHFVPKFYLRGFCLGHSPKQIYVFDRQNPDADVQIRSIDKIEVSKDAYSVTIDALISQREREWSSSLAFICQRNADDLNRLIVDREDSAEFRRGLASFVVDMRRRSRGVREGVLEPLKELRLQLRQSLAESADTTVSQNPELKSQLPNGLRQAERELGLDNDRRFAAIYFDPIVDDDLDDPHYKWHQDGSWSFEEAFEGREFITSDIPSHSLLLGPEPENSNWMLFVMPLSKRLQLTGFCGNARLPSGFLPRVGELDDREIDLANLCIFRSAARFVYGSSESELLRARDADAEQP